MIEELGQNAAALRQEWAEVRQGWCLGDEDFKERLLARVGAVLSGRKRESYTGLAVQAHDEQRAEQLLNRGLASLGMSLGEMQSLPQNEARKQGIAWLLRTATVVSGDWVSAQLRMGHRSNVSRAVRRFETGARDIASLRALLQPCKD